MDPSMALIDILEHRHQHGPSQPWTSAWTSVVTWAMNINTGSGYSRTKDPDMAPSGQTGGQRSIFKNDKLFLPQLLLSQLCINCTYSF